MLKQILIATAIAASSYTSTFAHDYRVGDLIVDHPVARATAPGAKVGGGYMTIENTGSAADRLIGGTATFAGKIEVHEMKMENDIMKMNRIEGGLEIPAGATVMLKPGGNHIMFMKLSEALKQGEKRKVQLSFEKSGSVEVIFKVKSIADTMHKMN